MGAPGPRPLIFDAGALLALEHRDPRMIQLVQDARAMGRPIVIPAPVLAQVWRGGRGRQIPIALLVRRKEQQSVQLAPLDELEAKAVGLLCAAVGHPDIVDAYVAFLSLLNGRAQVITSDPQDIARFSTALPTVRV